MKLSPRPRSKYGAVKTDGYASKREAKRAKELMVLEHIGRIKDITRQSRFEVIPTQYENGRCVERSVVYVCDFSYMERSTAPPYVWQHVVEDVKGVKTPAYIIKRKLMLWRLGIRVREVR